MFLEAIEHIPDSSYAHAIDESTLVIRLRAKKGDIKECILFYGDRVFPKEPISVTDVEMRIVASDLLFDYFEVDVKSEYTRVCYYFWLSDGITSTYYFGNEFRSTPRCSRTEYFQFPYIRREDIAAVPEWAKAAVIYQIFPDSFATSRKFISKVNNAIEHTSGEVCKSRNGGTIKGITENLDYLSDLGINCIYLNPIFSAGAYHKYDTIDYFTVDPCFGDNDTFKEFVQECHKRNIKVMLDGVFNHSGAGFFAFKDIMKNGESSRYKDWYYKMQFPVQYTEKPNYECFAYVREMPKLNTGNPEVIEYFCNVGTYWIKEFDIDGWRLDVANEIDHDFWRSFRKAVKAVKPDAFLVAEIWEDSHSWLQGDQFDSSMNYRFAYLCREFFAESKMSVDDFDAKINSLKMRYKRPITQAQMNFLDTHDVPRFLSYCRGDGRRLKLAALFTFMSQGVPSIYYGDEKGFSGVEEDAYRKPMAWEDDKVQAELTDYYKKLIRIRKEFMPVFFGECKTIIKDNGKNLYAYTMEAGQQKVTVVVNNSEFVRKTRIQENGLKGTLRDALSGETYTISNNEVQIELQPLSGAVLINS